MRGAVPTKKNERAGIRRSGESARVEEGDAMLISTKGRYALRVMIDLAENQGEQDYVPLKEVAKRQDISEKYLENIVKTLVRNGMLKGVRGKRGGYRLTKSPDEYSVGAVLRLTEGSLAPVACLEHTPIQCERAGDCRTLSMWKGLYEVVEDYLDGITLADLGRGIENADMYVI